jgi:RNA polymerase sigma-70 factor (ECF subfamily)
MEEKQSTFEEFCLPHLDAAYNLARLLVNRDQDAQEIVQEAYLKALKIFRRFHGENARAWILLIVRNTALSWLKKQPGDAKIVPSEKVIHSAPPAGAMPEASYGERERQLHEALNRLPIEYREILIFRDVEGWSYKQLASALNLPSGAVISRLTRARQHLFEEVTRVQDRTKSQNGV